MKRMTHDTFDTFPCSSPARTQVENKQDVVSNASCTALTMRQRAGGACSHCTAHNPIPPPEMTQEQ